MRRHFAAFAMLAVLAACETGGPYIYMNPTVTLTKVPDEIRKYGYFDVCYGDGEEAEADALAAATCADYKLSALKRQVQRYQCSMSKPHWAVYYCVDPNKRMADGTYINPLDKAQVKSWQDQQERIQAARQRHAGGEQPGAASGQLPAPGAAELGAPPPPAIPLTVPAKPAPAPALQTAPAPSAPAPGASAIPPQPDFDPPAGGWGQAWEAAGGDR